MNPVLLFGIVETAQVLLLIAILLLINWRNKRKHHAEFEQLLDDIKDRQGSRGNKLTRRFVDKYHLDKANALGLSDQLITAEKVFLQQFIEQQMQQKSPASFYENLCELLDSYLITIPATPEPRNQPEMTAPVQQATKNTSIDEALENLDAAPEPDWGDVFD